MLSACGHSRGPGNDNRTRWPPSASPVPDTPSATPPPVAKVPRAQPGLATRWLLAQWPRGGAACAGHVHGHQGLAGWGRGETTARQHQWRLGGLLGPWGQVALPRVGRSALGRGPVASASPVPKASQMGAGWDGRGLAANLNWDTYGNLDSIPHACLHTFSYCVTRRKVICDSGVP